MVLGISPSSPLSAYLSRGDVILSVDGENICSPLELKEKLVHRNGHDGKGYCVTNALLEESKSVSVLDGNFSCSDGHAAFSGLPCVNSSSSFEISYKEHGGHLKENKYCLSPEKVVKLGKCGEGWGVTGSLKKLCSCSEVQIYLFTVINTHRK
ncbi:membrane-bound transcription factor site-2 protease homolog [Phalaenopsis equestris]|uniref:membrane-bound transcription factor site-2 protease homolog n=1 Tax=Phalaenopsis equestris TaxID=78828 RepID=UPI0009E43470|nr:membrane-bound transcription factor site-2 protease homolog [Phalaenopsis equestris]